MAGRPTKYTPDRVKRIIQAIDQGATHELACAYAGISVDTMANWRVRYSEFSDQLREAEGRAAVKWLAKIEQAANVDWKAAAWKLERRHPQMYGKSVHDLTVNHGGTITHAHRDMSAFTDDEIDALAAVAERVKAGQS